jgi:hypothetical protein
VRPETPRAARSSVSNFFGALPVTLAGPELEVSVNTASQNVVDTLRLAFDKLLDRGLETLGAVWFIGTLCFPAYYIGVFWSSARDWGARVAVIAKAVAWAPF